MLRYASATEATIWVETDGPCEVEILGRRTRTSAAEGHHFALLAVRDLEPASSLTYDVSLDGERRWPLADEQFPPSRLPTLPASGPVTLIFGSCRVTAPHDPPYILSPDEDELGFGVDALYGLALRLREEDPASWPEMLLMIGDQVYADEVSPQTLEFIRSRRDARVPPGEEVADFEEYARLYQEAWGDPTLRWLLSTVPTAMIFDDHDVHDGWNTSEAWLAKIREQPWWQGRITSALASYWIYQHLGNFSPDELERDELYQRAREAEDAGPILRDFAAQAESEGGGGLWSFSRDIAGTRLVVLDGREGRVLSDGRREIVDDAEWAWIEERFSGDFDHLLIANTLPVLPAPTLHYLEVWDEAIAQGRWGRLGARPRALGGVRALLPAPGRPRPRGGERRARGGAGDGRLHGRRRPPGLPARGHVSRGRA